MLLLLLLLLVLFSTGGDLSILLRKDTDGTSGNFVVDYRFVVFADNVDTEFLGKCEGTLGAYSHV